MPKAVQCIRLSRAAFAIQLLLEYTNRGPFVRLQDTTHRKSYFLSHGSYNSNSTHQSQPRICRDVRVRRSNRSTSYVCVRLRFGRWHVLCFFSYICRSLNHFFLRIFSSTSFFSRSYTRHMTFGCKSDVFREKRQDSISRTMQMVQEKINRLTQVGGYLPYVMYALQWTIHWFLKNTIQIN